MTAATHYGEIEDGKLYTDKRLAQIFQRTRDWVLETFIFPVDPITGEAIAGVPYTMAGTIYQVSGEDLRLWHQQHAQPATRKPKNPKPKRGG